MRRRKKDITVDKPKLGRFGAILREDGLPYPIVFYPVSWASFLAFAKDKDNSPVLCSCSKQAAINAVKILRLQEIDGLRSPSTFPLSDRLFPDAIAKQSTNNLKDPFKGIIFVDGICHKCNLQRPSRRSRAYGRNSKFYQYYGMYVDQIYYRFGIQPLHPESAKYYGKMYYLEDCPDKYSRIIKRHNELANKHRDLSDLILREHMIYYYGRNKVESPDFDWDSAWQHLPYIEFEKTPDELTKLCNESHSLESQMDKCKIEIYKKILNEAHFELNYLEVNPNLKKEKQLYQIIREIYPGYMDKVRYQYRDEWLGKSSLDIYIPELKLAIEYQGEQHFKPIDHIGGEYTLEENQRRDKQKAKICRKNNVKLILVNYYEPLTIEHIRKKLIDNDVL